MTNEFEVTFDDLSFEKQEEIRKTIETQEYQIIKEEAKVEAGPDGDWIEAVNAAYDLWTEEEADTVNKSFEIQCLAEEMAEKRINNFRGIYIEV